jgi:GNAT superfamily N-acetyltransferase
LVPPDRARFAEFNDAGQLARLRWASRGDDEQVPFSYDEFRHRFSSWLLDALASGTWHAAVIPKEAGLVGCMYLQCVATVPVPGVIDRRWGYVTHAYVEEAYRNRGNGRKMLELLVAKAHDLALHELHVWPSRPAVTLYTRAGFLSPEQQRALPTGDEPSYILSLNGDRTALDDEAQIGLNVRNSVP